MELRLPIPIFLKDNIYTHVEVKTPTAKVLADTNDVINSAGEYMGMRNLISGCIERVFNENNEITDSVSIKSLVFKMPNKTAEFVSTDLIVDFFNGDDYVTGIYPCPICRNEEVSKQSFDIDTRDRISDLKVVYMEVDEYQNSITVNLSEPVIIKVKNEELQVDNITIGYPTLEHHHKAYTRFGNTNTIRYQLAIYSEALIEVNGQAISDEWRRSYGMKIFENMSRIKEVTDKFSDFINKYGRDLRVEKICKSCGEVWQPIINTSNFFGSALQLR